MSLRQLTSALFEFDIEFGSYPTSSTGRELAEAYPDFAPYLEENSSNAIFRQLIVSEILEDEQIFYAKVPGVRKPDNNMAPDKLLEKGEVAFGYVAGLSDKSNPSRIVAFFPVVPGTKRFDPRPFNGQAIILKIDNSISSYKIREDGTIGDEEGNLLSPQHPIWGGEAPDIRYPDL